MLKRGQLLEFTLILVLLAYPLLFRRKFSELSHWYYDLILVNPAIICYVSLIMILVGLLVIDRRRLGLFSLISIVLVFSVLGAATDYPMLIDTDVNLHGSSVEVIVQEGHLSEAWNHYHESYPGFFLMWSSISLVTGLDVRTSNITILLPISVILLVLLMVVLFRRLGFGKDASCTVALLAFLLMNFHINEGLFLHFNTGLYALTLVVLALLFLFRMNSQKGRKEQGAFLLIFYVVVASHIFYSLLLLVFLLLYWLIFKRRDWQMIQTVLFSVALYFGHNFLVASRMYGYYLRSLFDYFYTRLGREMVLTIPFVTDNIPFAGIILRNYYKALLLGIGLLAIYSAIRLRSKASVRGMLCLLIAGSVVSGVSIFTINSANTVTRGLALLTIPLAFFSLYPAIGEYGKTIPRRRVWLLTLVVLLLIVPQFLLVNEHASIRMLDAPSLDTACLFVTNVKNGQPITGYGVLPHYFCFYDPQFYDYYVIGYPYEGPQYVTGVKNLSQVADFFLQGKGIKFITLRDVQAEGYNLSSFEEAYAKWTSEVFLPLESDCNKIYDNCFERVYR